MNIHHFLLLLTIGLLASCTTGQEKKVLQNLNSVEPKNSKLSPKKLSSKQLLDAKNGAEEGIRTPDPLLGKEMLYH